MWCGVVLHMAVFMNTKHDQNTEHMLVVCGVGVHVAIAGNTERLFMWL